MGFIRGEERILFIKDSDIWYPVAFLTSNSFSGTTEFLPTTTRDNAGFSTNVPISKTETISFSAIMAEDADITQKIGYKRLKELQDGRVFFEWKLQVLNKNFTDYGRGYLSELSEAAEVDGLMTFDGSINVYGKALNILDTEAPSVPFLNPLSQDALGTVMLINWEVSTDNLTVAGYELRKSEGKTVTITDVGNVTSYSDNSVVPFAFYGYNVRAYDVAGNFSAWSNKRAGSVLTPPGTPDENYMLFEDGQNILTEDGTPLTFE